MKLYQIIDLLRSDLIKSDILFSDEDFGKKNPKFKELFEGYGSKAFESNGDAAEELYGKGPDYPYFFQVKSRFVEQLLKNIVHLDFDKPEYPRYRREEVKAQLNLFQMKVLARFGQKENVIWLAKRVLKTSIAYGFTSFVLEAARTLRNDTSYFGNIKDFEKYDAIVSKYEVIDRAENEADRIHFKIKTLAQKSVKNVIRNKEVFLQSAEHVKILFDEFQTPLLAENYYKVLGFAYEFTNQFERYLEFVEEIEDLKFNKPEIFFSIRERNLTLDKGMALARLGRFEEGLEYIGENLKVHIDGSINYFVALEDYFKCAMRSGNFQLAMDTVNSVLNHPKNDILTSLYKERWELFKHFSLFVTKAPMDQSFQFLNFFPEYSKDKQGYNISILCLQFMMLLQNGNFDGMVNKVEALRMYMVRQISKSQNRRAQYFIRLIQVAHTNNFDSEKSRLHGNKVFNLLKQFPENSDQFNEMEIISYQKMWEMCLDLMAEKTMAYSVAS